MDNVTRLLMQGAAGAGGGATYVDDVFSTYLYTGNNTARSINNAVNMSKGGMTWIKSRSHTLNGNIFSSNLVNGSGTYGCLQTTDTDGADYSNTGSNAMFTAFNNNGFSLGADSATGRVNYTTLSGTPVTYASWSFAKQKGFFDIQTWTGNGTDPTQIPHNLGCVPGFIMIKCTSHLHGWACYHKDSKDKLLELNSNFAGGSSIWKNTTATSTYVTVDSQQEVNGNGKTYVGYFFAGGESTAATARSVDFDGSNDELKVTNSNSDFQFGTGDFTVEAFVNYDEEPSSSRYIVDMRSSAGTSAGALAVGYSSDNTKIEWARPNQPILNVPWANYISAGTWNHIAVAKSGSTIKMFINGLEVDSATDNNDYGSDPTDITIGDRYSNSAVSQWFNGKISNVRIVKGTAVYTSSFKPPTEPLTNITNTKLLCCNNSSTTGSTVTPGTITANSNPAASTDSPFDDPEGFKFGEEEDQNLIKTGSYVGNGSSTGPKINLGWEPQWVMVKRTDTPGGTSWVMLDTMRAWTVEGEVDAYMYANSNDSESVHQWGAPTSTGMQMDGTDGTTNASGGNYIYVAIRRPDGLVGKPASAATDVFTMDFGNGSSTIPAYDSGFPVDYGLLKEYGGNASWYASSRLTGTKYLQTDNTNNEGSMNNWVFDSNVGWAWGSTSGYISYMWKRRAGFDVVTYTGNSSGSTSGDSQVIPHNLGKSPEMIWAKKRNGSGYWGVYHKGLNGGTNPADYRLILNESYDESVGGGTNSSWYWNDTLPTATQFSVGEIANVNENNKTFIALLFTSVEGISKVGSYTGTGASGNSITLGFQPRFLLVKNANNAAVNWVVYDTLRGWTGTNDKFLNINQTYAQGTTTIGPPTSTGFTVNATNTSLNSSGDNFIYYAHA